MVDQSLLSAQQDGLLQRMTVAWDAVKASQGQDEQATRQAAEHARDALLYGGEWPDPAWVEYVLLVGASTCNSAVLNKGRYVEYYEIVDLMYREMTNRHWEGGGPTGYFNEYDARMLVKSADQWKTHMVERLEAEEGVKSGPPKKRGWFARHAD